MTLLVGPPLTPAAVLRELARLRRQLELLELTRGQRHEASAALTSAEEELARETPDARRVAGQLARFTTVLRSAGALPDSRGALTHALARLRIWLGPLPF
jgi:hypothetical protein